MRASLAVALYAGITALLFLDLLPVLGTHLLSDVGDPLLNATILAWNARQVPLTDAWWNFPAFAPLSGVTAFTEHLLLFYPVSTPIVWLTGNAVLAHNVVLLACFPLNGLAAYLLARHLTGSATAAFVGGLAFAFAPYHSFHIAHLQMLPAFGMPLALLGLHRGSLPLFGAGWLITALSNAYMLVFFPVLVALWCAWFIRPREWRRLLAIVGTAVLVALPLVPLLRGYQVRQAAYGFSRQLGEMRQFAADLIGLLAISHRETLWRGVLPHTYEEGSLFPGLTIALLAIAAVAAARGARGTAGAGIWSRRLAWLAAAITAVVAARMWTGPFGWRLGPLPLPPFTPFRLFTVAVVAALLAAVLSPRFRAAWARRDPVIFYAAAVVVLWLIALGPQPEWSASRLRALTYGPFQALASLPGFSSLRVPARAWLPAVLCLSVLAAFGAAALLRRRAAVAVAALFIVAEGWFTAVVVPAPAPMPPGIVPAGALVLDLPMHEGFWNATPQYRAVLGGYRTINGYSGYEPPHFNPLRHEIADLYLDALNPYRRLADLHVIIRPGEAPRVVRWVMEHPGADVVHDAGGTRIVRLPAMSDPPRPRIPLPLPRPGQRPFGLR